MPGSVAGHTDRLHGTSFEQPRETRCKLSARPREHVADGQTHRTASRECARDQREDERETAPEQEPGRRIEIGERAPSKRVSDGIAERAADEQAKRRRDGDKVAPVLRIGFIVLRVDDLQRQTEFCVWCRPSPIALFAATGLRLRPLRLVPDGLLVGG
jgi:hypothetical protein